MGNLAKLSAGASIALHPQYGSQLAGFGMALSGAVQEKPAQTFVPGDGRGEAERSFTAKDQSA